METCFKDLIIFNNDIFFNDFAFQPFDFECLWWRLFQKRVMRTKLDIYVCIISLQVSGLNVVV